ncbi:MAG: hypothetical protein GTO45_06230 [Candidatus Aminicenantes bacterium]|nr:hypothetical protein [Candidatus Aminicenantes bacterium]NIM78421.1 hypothetical protein [Candidatus Aminicenantes bacterium]NIN17683.1 hypothetical protein [Candidatus Aminicenantes bacterium]NIN41559.1 hypothetical protein [Candidatus Aminicenantes bacterium]NIN84333.1 hypothetical protein [Candidatus Aminicenantes bacterium]
MYFDNTKALLMTNDPEFQEKMEHYLFNRYNLKIDTAANSLEVLERFASANELYEMIILDEEIDGLSTASHVFKTIKEQNEQVCVMFRSTLREITDPYNQTAFALPPEYADKNFRLDLANRRLDTINSLIYPVIKSSSMEEIYQKACQGLMKVFKADYTLFVINRTDEKPIKRGNMVWDTPERIKELPYEFDFKGPAGAAEPSYLETLVKYCKPIYFPDVDTDKNKEFLREIKEKFSYTCRSVLLVPMVFDKMCIGFFGMFYEKDSRLYNLLELDIILKLADFTTVAIIAIFLKEHMNLKIEIPKMRELSEFPELSGTLF